MDDQHETSPQGAPEGPSAAAATNGGTDDAAELFASLSGPSDAQREMLRELGLTFRSVEQLETKMAAVEAELAILIGLSLLTLGLLTILIKKGITE